MTGASKKHRNLNTTPNESARTRTSALILVVVLATQMLLMGAAIAQTVPAFPDPNQPQGNAGGAAQGQAANTQDTVPNPYINAKGFIPAVTDSSQVNVHGGGSQYGSARGIFYNVPDLLKVDNPNGVLDQPGVDRASVFIPGQNVNGNPNAFQQQFQNNQQLSNQATTLVLQAAEQNVGNPQGAVNNPLSTSLGSINDTYRGMHQWFNDDIIGNLFQQIGQLIGKWISEVINGWIADTVQFLAAFLRVFVLNPNIAVNGLNGSPSDGISPYIRQGADVMYGIAVDLLLLLFILAIWKYWAEAAWRGAGNLMGAVGRLIFTAGLMLAFPTLYAFEIQITNEMIKAIYFNSTDQIAMLDSALASAVRGGILAGVGGLASAFAPLLGGVGLGIAGGLVGEVFAFAGLVIFLILGGILIAELVYILVLKAIQTALLTAQYMFAPLFLVFYATPDTENVATGFVKAWVETSLWTFVWVGLLKIMVIIMFSDYNPWGKILMSVGVLQMMIQVPTFLARAQISPMSDFISAGLVTGGLMKMFGWMGSTVRNRAQQGLGYFLNDRIGQQGFPQTSRNAVNGLATNTGPGYGRLAGLRQRAQQQPGTGTNGNPLERAGAKGLKKDKDGNPIDPVSGKAIKRDKDGNLIDPLTGKPMSAERMKQLGLQGPPNKKDQDKQLKRDAQGNPINPATGLPFQKDKNGNLIDPKTGKPMTPEAAAALGMTTKGLPLGGMGGGGAGGAGGTGAGTSGTGRTPPPMERSGASGLKTDAQGRLIDPQSGKPFGKDKDGKLIDPTTGKPITAAKAQALGINQKGEPLTAGGKQGPNPKEGAKDPLKDAQGRLIDPTTQQPFQKDKDGNLIDPSTGKAITPEKAAALGLTTKGEPLKGAQGPGAGPQRDSQGRLIDPDSKMPFTEKDAKGNLIDPSTKKPITAEKAAAMGITRTGQVLRRTGQQGPGDRQGAGGAPQVKRDEQGRLVDAATGKALPVDEKGNLKDPTTGKTYSVDQEGRLIDTATGKELNEQQKQQVLNNMGVKAGPPSIDNKGGGTQGGGAGGAKDGPVDPGKGPDVQGVAFKKGFTPSKEQVNRFLSLRKSMGTAAAAAAVFGGSAAVVGGAGAIGQAMGPGIYSDQQTGKQYQIDQEGRVIDAETGKQVNGAEKQAVLNHMGLKEGPGGQLQRANGTQGNPAVDAGKAADVQGVAFKQGFNPSPSQIAKYTRLRAANMSPMAAAREAFGAGNIAAAAMSGGAVAAGMYTDPQTGRNYQIDSEGRLIDSTGQQVTGQERAAVLTHMGIREGANGLQRAGATTSADPSKGVDTKGADVQGVAFNRGFTPTASAIQKFTRLRAEGKSPMAAAREAFGAGNVTAAAMNAGAVGAGMYTDPQSGRTYQIDQEGRLIDSTTGQQVSGQERTAVLNHMGIREGAGGLQRTAAAPGGDGKGVEGAGKGVDVQGVGFRQGFTPSRNAINQFTRLRAEGKTPMAAAREAFGAGNVTAASMNAGAVGAGMYTDPQSGRTYQIDQEGRLIDSATGQQVTGQDRAAVLNHMGIREGAGGLQRAATTGGDNGRGVDGAAKSVDVQGVGFRQGYTPSRNAINHFTRLRAEGKSPAAAAQAAFGAANLVPAAMAAGNLGAGMYTDPQTGRNYQVDSEGRLIDSNGQQVTGQDRATVLNHMGVKTDGNPVERGGRGGDTGKQGGGDIMKAPEMQGVRFAGNFTPSTQQVSNYLRLVRSGSLDRQGAAAAAFGAGKASFDSPNLSPAASHSGPGQHLQQEQTVAVDQSGGNQQRDLRQGSSQVRDESQRGSSSPSMERASGGGDRPWTFKDNFSAKQDQINMYHRLVGSGVPFARAAAQAFGSGNININPALAAANNMGSMQQTVETQHTVTPNTSTSSPSVSSTVNTQNQGTGQQQQNLGTMQQQGTTVNQSGSPAQLRQQELHSVLARRPGQPAPSASQVNKYHAYRDLGMPEGTAANLAFGVVNVDAGGPGGPPNGPSGPTGPGGTPPPPPDDPSRRISHLKNPTAGDLDQAGLWMVAGARNPVGDIRNLKLQVRANQGSTGRVWGTTRGGYSRIDLPDDATPAQIAGMFAVAGYANEINNDPAAMDAARSAAVEMGAHKPKGWAQSAAANLNSYYGGNWASTGLGKQQFQNAMYSAAVEGATGYVSGKNGNSYTQYLRQRYGAFDQERMDTLTLISTDPEAAESAWNAGIVQATDRLIASGTKISAANRGAALNPYVASLRPAAAGSAIRAMVLYGMNDPRMAPPQGMTRDDFVNSGEGGMLLGEVLRGMNPEEAKAVHETFLQTGGADLSSHIVAPVTNLAMQNNTPAGVAYRALSSNLGTVASNVTGNSAFKGAKTFDQVHKIATQQYGSEVGGQMYDTVVRVANERAQIGLQTVGRLVVDQDVAGIMDGAMEQIGGWQQVADSADVGGRDRVQTMANAVGLTVSRLGAHAATPQRAHAVYRYMSDGNQGAQSLSAQDIIIAERLVGNGPGQMGAQRISQSMVQVLRNLDAENMGNIDLTTVQDIAGQVDAGNARPDQAYAVNMVRGAGYKVTRQAVEIAASLDSMDAYSPETFRVVANLVSSGVVQNASSAPTVFTTAVSKAARDAGIDINQPLNKVLSQLEAQGGGNAGTIASDIAALKVSGGFEDRQLVDPMVFEAAYDAMHDPSSSAHRVQSIRIAERIHGHGSIKDPGVLNVYDDMLESGVDPQDLTDDYVGLQRYYAASALRAAQAQYTVPAGKKAPQPTTRMLDRIRTDPRFVMRNARPNSPPKMGQQMFYDLLQGP